MDPDPGPGDPKTCGSGSGSGSPTLLWGPHRVCFLFSCLGQSEPFSGWRKCWTNRSGPSLIHYFEVSHRFFHVFLLRSIWTFSGWGRRGPASALTRGCMHRRFIINLAFCFQLCTVAHFVGYLQLPWFSCSLVFFPFFVCYDIVCFFAKTISHCHWYV